MTFTFTVNPPPTVTPIHEVQGDGPRSPFAPDTGSGAGDVKTVEGVVTALYRTGGFNGMYIQTGGTGGLDRRHPGCLGRRLRLRRYERHHQRRPESARRAQHPDEHRDRRLRAVTGPVSEFFDSTQITPANAAAVVELGSPARSR